MIVSNVDQIVVTDGVRILLHFNIILLIQRDVLYQHYVILTLLVLFLDVRAYWQPRLLPSLLFTYQRVQMR